MKLLRHSKVHIGDKIPSAPLLLPPSNFSHTCTMLSTWLTFAFLILEFVVDPLSFTSITLWPMCKASWEMDLHHHQKQKMIWTWTWIWKMWDLIHCGKINLFCRVQFWASLAHPHPSLLYFILPPYTLDKIFFVIPFFSSFVWKANSILFCVQIRPLFTMRLALPLKFTLWEPF